MALIDVLPPLMQVLRSYANQNRDSRLSVQQFRALGFLRNNPSASISDVAEYLGVALPTASRLIGGLVRKQLLAREPLPRNRRQMRMTLSPAGQRLLNTVIRATAQQLADRAATIPRATRRDIISALNQLRKTYPPILHGA